MFGFPDIQKEIGQAMIDAPKNIASGLGNAVMFLPKQLVGFAQFGGSIWSGMTPEQQETVKQAIIKLVVTSAEAYVKGKAEF